MTRTATALVALLATTACAADSGGLGQAERAAVPTDAGDAAQAAPTDAYLGTQADELASIPGAEVERRDDAVRVNFQSSVLFETGSYTLGQGADDRLRPLAHTLNEYPKSSVIIKGHTDSTGDDRFNRTLSGQRADSVRKFLLAEGVAHDRITAIGFGAQMPVATNNTPEGRHQNRRIEIEIRPEQQITSEASR